jgi:PAS domain-containing protein
VTANFIHGKAGAIQAQVLGQIQNLLDDAGLRRLMQLGDLAVSLLRLHSNAIAMADLSARVCRQADFISDQAKALTEQKRIMASAAKLAKIGAFELDVATGHLEWCDGMYAIHELDRAQALNTYRQLKFFPQPDRSRLKHMMEEADRNGTPFTFEGRMKTAKGNLRWIRLVSDVELKDGKAVRRFGMKQDISEEKVKSDRILRLWLHVDRCIIGFGVGHANLLAYRSLRTRCLRDSVGRCSRQRRSLPNTSLSGTSCRRP